MSVSVFSVFVFAMITALATGLGAIPFAFTPRMSRWWLGMSNGLAAGLMIAASLMLVYEGSALSIWRTAAGLFAGIAFLVGSRRWLDGNDGLQIGNLVGADARKALLIVGVMTIHSFTEGIGVGVSFGGGEQLGIFITTAIAVHNIPEGLAISLILVPRGISVWRAAWWSIFSSLPQPLMAIPAFLFVSAFSPWLPAGLGFAAGAMLWMVARELIPEAVQEAPWRPVAVTVVLGGLAMMLFQIWLKG